MPKARKPHKGLNRRVYVCLREPGFKSSKTFTLYGHTLKSARVWVGRLVKAESKRLGGKKLKVVDSDD